jgi:phospholipid/cholesterol/gamma-HCH transport system substrate-binding protein
MKPAINKRLVLTGIFVVIGITILIAGILVVAGKNKSFSKTIIVKAIFEDVNGLAKGNNVWYAGVKVGTVKKVVFAGNGVEVNFAIDESVKQFIRLDSKVKLSSDGLIGNKIIVLYGGSAAAPAIAPGSILQVEKALSTEAIMTTLQENNKNLLQITQNFKDLSNNMLAGNGTIGRLLKDESLINNLQATLQTLHKTSIYSEMLTANLADFTLKLNSKGSLTNDLLTDTIIVTSLQSAVRQINEVSKTANNAVHNLNTTTNALNDTIGTVGLLLNDEETAASMKSMVQNLQSGAQKLDENMEALQHNFLFRGFFRQKAKAAKTKDKGLVAAPVMPN